jgi:hypothetical protein
LCSDWKSASALNLCFDFKTGAARSGVDVIRIAAPEAPRVSRDNAF